MKGAWVRVKTGIGCGSFNHIRQKTATQNAMLNFLALTKRASPSQFFRVQLLTRYNIKNIIEFVCCFQQKLEKYRWDLWEDRELVAVYSAYLCHVQPFLCWLINCRKDTWPYKGACPTCNDIEDKMSLFQL
jgi:hypothetical protein